MPQILAVGADLAAAGAIVVTPKGNIVDPKTTKRPIHDPAVFMMAHFPIITHHRHPRENGDP